MEGDREKTTGLIVSVSDESTDDERYTCVPDVFYEDQHATSADASSSADDLTQREGVADRHVDGQAGGTTGDKDLTKEGFIPFAELTLEHLPESIRTEESLKWILEVGERVVRVILQLSDKRPDDDQMKKQGLKRLRGTGFVFAMVDVMGLPHAVMVTNRHVLYNTEEVRTSTMDFFCDQHGGLEENPRWTRTTRGGGVGALQEDSRDDLVATCCRLTPKVMGNLKGDPSDCGVYLRHVETQPEDKQKANSKPSSIVCVISHPLGQHKQVSFGEIVEVKPEKNTFLHTAPTRQGSSGAPILIFSNSIGPFLPTTHVYHEGVNEKSGLKVGHVVRNCLEGWQSSNFPTYATVLTDRSSRIIDSLSMDDVKEGAEYDVTNISLSAYCAVLGSYVLHPEACSAAVTGTQHWEACTAMTLEEIGLDEEQQNELNELLSEMIQHFPGMSFGKFNTGGSQSNILSLLMAQGPCHCQAIVEAVVGNAKAHPEAEVYLRPDVTYAKIGSYATWPWSQDPSRNAACVPSQQRTCLLKRCLDNFRQSWKGQTAASLLLLVSAANNVYAAKHGTDVDADERKTETVPSLQFVISVIRKALYASRLVQYAFQDMMEIFRIWWPYCDNLPLPAISFGKTLLQIQHLHLHFHQDHPDWERPRGTCQEFEMCTCGRPSFVDLTAAMENAVLASEEALGEMGSTDGSDGDLARTSAGIPRDDEGRGQDALSYSGLRVLLAKSRRNTAEYSEESWRVFLNDIDAVQKYAEDRDIITRTLVATEVLTFNCRQLLRQCAKSVHPRWIASPVSVFGRPGRWPGNITPAAVQDTAWKLIQDAFPSSGLGPGLLQALEKDTDRRQKLMDLYVDMKQLKFAGELDVGYLNADVLQDMVGHLQVWRNKYMKCPYHPNATTYVMMEFLDVLGNLCKIRMNYTGNGR